MIKVLLDQVILLALKLLFWLLGHLPENLARITARCVIKTIILFIPRARNVALRNLELVFPSRATEDRLAIYQGSLDILAENILTFANACKLTEEEVDTRVVNMAECKKAIEDIKARNPGIGVLFPAMHFGCYEWFVQACGLKMGPVYILARGLGFEKSDKWLNARRGIFGNQIFSRKGGYRFLEKHLKEGRQVTLLVDQNVKANHAVFVDLFGIPAATTKAVALAAMRTGAPIMFLVGAKLSKDKYRAYFFELPNPNSYEGDMEEKIKECTRKMNECVEEVITKHPDHWFWVHRRFKTRPPGQPESIYSN